MLKFLEAIPKILDGSNYKDFIYVPLITSLSSNDMKKAPLPESAREIYQPRNSRLSAKLVSTFANRECCAVSEVDPYGRILGFVDRSRYMSFQVAPQLYSRG
jgi:hypothetical protein